MSTSSNLNKEQIIRGVLNIIQNHPVEESVEIGPLVIFLEKNFATMAQGNQLDLEPLWDFCSTHYNWSYEAFQDIFSSLEPQLQSTGLHGQLAEPRSRLWSRP